MRLARLAVPLGLTIGFAFQVGVFRRVFVALRAMRDMALPALAHVVAALHVLGQGDRFEVFRIDAARVAAQVIQHQAGRDSPLVQFIGDAVGVLVAVQVEAAVALGGLCARPVPAAARLRRDELLETRQDSGHDETPNRLQQGYPPGESLRAPRRLLEGYPPGFPIRAPLARLLESEGHGRRVLGLALGQGLCAGEGAVDLRRRQAGEVTDQIDG